MTFGLLAVLRAHRSETMSAHSCEAIWLGAPWRRPFSRRNGRHGGGWGYCYACGTSWKYVYAHDTFYSAGSGCFPLCQPCWVERTPAERLPFYRQLWEDWTRRGSDKTASTWRLIEDAVMAGF